MVIDDLKNGASYVFNRLKVLYIENMPGGKGPTLISQTFDFARGFAAGEIIPFTPDMAEGMEPYDKEVFHLLNKVRIEAYKKASESRDLEQYRKFVENVEPLVPRENFFDAGRLKNRLDEIGKEPGVKYTRATPTLSVFGEMKFTDFMQHLPGLEKILNYCQVTGITPEDLIRSDFGPYSVDWSNVRIFELCGLKRPSLMYTLTRKDREKLRSNRRKKLRNKRWATK